MIHTEYLRSSAVLAATYDDEAQKLSITFQGGRTYDFSDVPMDVYEGLITAPSPGSFYHNEIKDQYA